MNEVLAGLYQNWDGLAHPEWVAYRKARSLGLGRAFQASRYNEVDLSTVRNLILVSRGVRDSIFHPIDGVVFISVFLDFENNLEILKSKIHFASTDSIPMIAQLNLADMGDYISFLKKDEYSYMDGPIIGFQCQLILECRLDCIRLIFSNVAVFERIEILGNLTLDVKLSDNLEEDEVYYDVQVNVRPFEDQMSLKSLCVERGDSSDVYVKPFYLTCKNICNGDVMTRALHLRGIGINIVHELMIKVSAKVDENQKRQCSSRKAKKVCFVGLPKNPPER